jgi:hypothetical protein
LSARSTARAAEQRCAAARSLWGSPPDTPPWVSLNAALLTVVVIIARTPSLLLTGAQGKLRYYALWVLWIPAIGSPLSSKPIRLAALWLMAGVLMAMAMVAYNQRRTGPVS